MLEGELQIDAVLSVSGDDLLNFRSGCAFVVLLARGVLEDLHHNGGAKCFLGYGQQKFESSLGHKA
jgi:hypothetical protein